MILEAPNLISLLIRLNQGDEEAFNVIYKTYSKPLYRKILRLTKNADDTDELLQELFIKIWDNREKIDPEKSFEAYIYTIAQNLVYNYFRKIASDFTLINKLLSNETGYSLSAEELFENKQLDEMLKQAIEQLPPQQKRVYNLCKVEGKSYNEAGIIMGISTATVNSHMTKSAKSIRDYLIKHHGLAFILLGIYFSKYK